jgi:muramoyltetrapeptide carboxypeptidase
MDLQHGIDREDVKAIICARGGYGSIQLVDKLQWASMLRSPKWLVGFSDITVFHQRMQRLGLPSIHATMPLNFEENTAEAIESLIDALQGNPTTHTYTTSSYAKEGIASGKLVGGNLSILYSLLGTDDQIDYTDCILFVEDLSEQLYHIDRMFFALEKAGVLDKIRGLVIGGMTEMKDTPIPIGKTLEQLILDHFQYRKIPIAFSFPAGHIPDNRALVLGQHYTLEITSNQTSLSPYC